LPAATLRNTEELTAWLDAVRANVEAKLKEGPVIL
jgi:hypothetical protein